MKAPERLICKEDPASMKTMDRAMDKYFEKWYLFHRSKRPPKEDQFWSVLPSHDFMLNTMQIGLRSMGDGPNILLVHGESGRGSQFSAIAHALAESGWRTLLIDFSDEKNSKKYKLSSNDIVAAFTEIIRTQGPLHGIVAHSLGNLWVWYAIARGLRINHLVSISGVFHSSVAFEYFQRLNRLTDAEMRNLKIMLTASEGCDALTMQDPSSIIAHIPRPQHGLIIQGRDDEIVNLTEGKAYSTAWQEADYLEIPEVLHANLLKNPSVVRKVKKFFVSFSDFHTKKSLS